MPAGLYRLYRRVRYGEPIIVVSGLPRSGTSMLMKMLEAGGMPLMMDGIRTADEDNPKGYFEHERVKHLANERDKSWLAEARGKAIKIISHLLQELPPTNNYKILLIRRDLREVLASQSKMLARRGQTPATEDERMLRLYENDARRVSDLMSHARHFEILELRYHEVLADGVSQAGRINEFLCGALDVAKMASVVDQQLYRNRSRTGPAS